MKKTNAKLQLKSERIRLLAGQELQQIVGGTLSNGWWTSSCPPSGPGPGVGSAPGQNCSS